jgi:hypothetical protein
MGDKTWQMEHNYEWWDNAAVMGEVDVSARDHNVATVYSLDMGGLPLSNGYTRIKPADRRKPNK